MDQPQAATTSHDEANAAAPPPGPPGWATPVIVLITVGVYLPAVFSGFVALDDDWNVFRNPFLHPVTFSNVLQFWTSAYTMNYSPLVHTLHAVEMLLWGDWPIGYHAVNVLLHAASTALLFRILCGFVPNARAAAVGALLFALHPIQAESVAWVTGRLAVLSGFLAIVSIGQFVEWRKTGHPRAYAFAFLAALLAMFAKPAAVCIPLLLVAIDLFVLKHSLRRSVQATLALFVVAAGFAVWARAVQPVSQLDFIPSWWQRPLVASDALAFYLYKIFVPFHFGPDYGRSPVAVLEHAWVYATAALPVLLLVLSFVLPGRRFFPASVLLFVFGALPSLGLAPFTFQRYSTVADRYIYLAMLGPALAATWIVSHASAKKIVAIPLVLLAGLSVQTVFQVLAWHTVPKPPSLYTKQEKKTFEQLYKHGLSVNPKSALMRGGLANLYLTEGNMDEAISLYRTLIRQGTPNLPEVHNNLATALLRNKNLTGAVYNYQRALELNPNYTNARAGLGDAYLTGGSLEKAREQYEAVREVEPDNPRVLANLAAVYVRTGQPSRAVPLYHHLLKIVPEDWRIHQSLGNVLRNGGDIDGAIAAYENVVKYRPDGAEARLALGDLYTSRKRYDQAIIQYSNLLDQTTNKDIIHLRLGAVFTAKGDVDRAIRHFSEAVRISPYNPDAHKALAQLYLTRKETDQAMAHLSESLRLRSNDAGMHVQLGGLLYAKKKVAEAADQYRQAVKLAPDNVAAANYLAWILATNSDQTLRDPGEAVRLAEHAAELTGRTNGSILDTLAAAYAEAGRFKDALATARQARTLTTNKPELAAKIDARIALYEKNKPFREDPQQPPQGHDR